MLRSREERDALADLCDGLSAFEEGDSDAEGQAIVGQDETRVSYPAEGRNGDMKKPWILCEGGLTDETRSVCNRDAKECPEDRCAEDNCHKTAGEHSINIRVVQGHDNSDEKDANANISVSNAGKKECRQEWEPGVIPLSQQLMTHDALFPASHRSEPQGLGEIGKRGIQKKKDVFEEKAKLRTFKDVGQGTLVYKTSGLKIKDALMSSAQLEGLLSRYSAVKLDQIQSRAAQDCIPKNWCTLAVVGEISDVRNGSNGSPYISWKLTDLDDTLIMLSLFGDAYQEFKNRVRVGALVLVVSPGRFRSTDKYILNLNSSDQIRILGQSSDFGICKFVKNGQRCRIPVNISKCEFCAHHVKKAYNRMASGRLELQGGSLKTAFSKSINCSKNWGPGKFDSGDSKKPPLPRASLDQMVGIAQKASSRGLSAGAKYVNTCARPEIMHQLTEDIQKKKMMNRLVNSNRAPIPLQHVPNVVLNSSGKKSRVQSSHNSQQRPPLTSLAGKSLLYPSSKGDTVELCEEDGTDSIFALEVSSMLPKASDPNRGKAAALLKAKARSDEENVPSFLVQSLNHMKSNGMAEKPTEDPKAAFERQYFVEGEIGSIPAAFNGEVRSQTSRCRQADEVRRASQPSNPVKKHVSEKKTKSTSLLNEGFGSIIAEMEAKSRNKPVHSNYKKLVDQGHDDELNKVLNTLEKRDNVAMKMDSTKSLKVMAWYCTVCHQMMQRRHPKCEKAHPHALKRKETVKRWWRCTECKRQFETLAVSYPVGACPKCNSTSANFEKSSMLKESNSAAMNMLTDGVACSEALKPRGEERKWIHD